MPDPELTALQAVDNALSGLPDAKAQQRVLTWAWEKYASAEVPKEPSKKSAKKKVAAKKSPGKKTGKGTKAKLSIVKELNLAAKGKKSFKKFCEQKAPTSHQEKGVVAVYYLTHELEISEVTVSHVYTCFKNVGNWRIPADLFNTLAYAASQKGWLDTSDSQNLRVMPAGENLVEHDLPKPKKK